MILPMFMLPPREIKYDVFLSYSRTDTLWLEGVAGRLRREGHSVWLDPWAPEAGGAWQQQVILGLDKARSTAICLGREMPVAWLEQRLRKAFGRQDEDPAFRALPLLLPDATAVDRERFARVRTWADFRRGSDVGLAFQVLLSAVRGQPVGRWPPPEPRAGEETTLAERVASGAILADSPFHGHLLNLIDAATEGGTAGSGNREFRYDLFLSYSQVDLNAVRHLAPWLADAGLRPWFDPWELVPGASWQEEVAHARKDSAAIAVFLGSRGLPGGEARFTPGDGSSPRESLIPVLLPGSSRSEIRPELTHEVPLDFRSGLRDPVALRRLLAAVARSSSSAPAPTAWEIAGRLMGLGDPEGALPYYGKAAREAGDDTTRLSSVLNHLTCAIEAIVSSMRLPKDAEFNADPGNGAGHGSVS